jgi:N-dimethylarginine dimethylaminohydrolase
MKELPAAYQGLGWDPRQGAHQDELAAGRSWSRCGLDSEWGRLRQVVLTLPRTDWPAPDDWDRVQYLDPVDFRALDEELRRYADVLRALGVEVHMATAPPRGDGPPLYNSVFVRDQFFATGEGVVVGRLGSLPRAGEERHVAERLARLGVPILRTVRGQGCFEGADALWLTPRLVAIGTGNRTNSDGAAQVTALLAELGVEVLAVPLPGGIQHLLGILQIIGPRTAVLRRDKPIAPALRRGLLDRGFRILDLDAGDEITRGQAMNFVTVAAEEVVMLADRPETQAALAGAGVRVHATVRADQLLRAAGGLACATGVLERDLVESGAVDPSGAAVTSGTAF